MTRPCASCWSMKILVAKNRLEFPKECVSSRGLYEDED